jgi:hypothetical protein
MNSRVMLRCSLILPFLLAMAGLAQEPESSAGAVASVDLSGDIPINRHSLERILQIKSITGSFRLTEKATSFRLRLDFYRQGKRVPLKIRKAGVGGKSGRQYGQFAVQIVDLDHLKLGDPRPQHYRMFVSLLTSDEPDGTGVTAFVEFDVPKSQFDAKPRTGATGRFEQFAKEGSNSIPLFWSASGRVERAPSLHDLLENNPQSDILVGVLEIQ